MADADKSPTAYRTIGEVARELGVPQHRLRYWESCFPQLRPLTRAGDRRHYRPEDVALLRRIHSWLGEQGYTVRGVQALLARDDGSTVPSASLPEPAAPAVPAPPPPSVPDDHAAARLESLRAIRTLLATALATDE